MDTKGTAFAFGALGVATLFVVSGIKGVTLSDVLAGNTGDPLSASGGSFTSAQAESAGVDPGAALSPKDEAAAALADAEGATSTGTFDGVKVATWIIPILKYGRAHGWRGRVTSGFRSFAEQTRIWNSGVRPAAKPGTSNHEGAIFPRGAVDVTDAAQLSAILLRSKYASVLVWAGSKDPVHFSHPHNGSY